MSDDLPIYRRINGELVLVPKRDPSRRYSNVNGTHLIEFTDEEERQRDEEEARWKAEQPQREAEQRRKEREFANFKASLKYEHRVVAFLDIMGWEQAIDQSVENEKLTRDLGVAINSVQLHTDLIDWMIQNSDNVKWPGDPQITHFSDCVLISVAADSYAQNNLLFHLSSLVSHILSLGFVSRGGITKGPLIHRGNMAYGPALIKAYKMERDTAKTPRIILDPHLAEIWGEGPRYQNEDGSLIGYEKRWRLDSDGYRFYDYLQPFINKPDTPVNIILLKAQLQPVRQLISERLLEYKDDARILNKYEWMAKYFNDVVDEYSECGIDKITGI